MPDIANNELMTNLAEHFKKCEQTLQLVEADNEDSENSTPNKKPDYSAIDFDELSELLKQHAKLTEDLLNTKDLTLPQNFKFFKTKDALLAEMVKYDTRLTNIYIPLKNHRAQFGFK